MTPLRPWLSVAAILAVGCVLAAEPPASERLSFSTYRERRGSLTLLVDGYPASFHPADSFIPVSVAVGYSGRGPVRFTLESFVLVDGRGRAYPAASYREILEGHAKLTFDRTLVRHHRLVLGQQFTNYTPVPARFYAGVDRGTRTSRVELARFTWFRDVLYFPMPDSGLDGVLTLRVSPSGFDGSVEVRFPASPDGRARG